jgi:hypothetical protein
MSDKQLITMADMMAMSEAFAKSGYFKDAAATAQAFVKIQAGKELGLEPFFSMTNIHIIQGNPTLGAGAIAAKVKGSGKYDYTVVRQDDDGCHLDFYERLGDKRAKIGESIFTVDDAKRAGLTSNPTWTKFPRNMLFARAMSNGARWFTPDIFGGSVYTPDELGGDFVDADYSVQQPAVTVAAIEPEPEQKAPTRHWIDDAATRRRFWAYAHDTLALSDEDVHAALGVEHVVQFAGSKAEALQLLKDYQPDEDEAPLWDESEPEEEPVETA